MAAAPAIEFRSVTKKYGDTVVVDNLNLSIPRGSITVFVGPSGCGKTTSLRMINRMVEHTGGEILVRGEANTSHPAHELRRSMGYVLQQAGLMPPSIPWGMIAGVAVFGAVLAMIASAAPARRAIRVSPVAALAVD